MRLIVFCRRAAHGAQARVVGHRAILQYHPIVLIDGVIRRAGIFLAAHAGHDESAVVVPVIQPSHGAIRMDDYAAIDEPLLKRSHQRIILVVDRSLDAGERFDAGEFQQESVQIALEFGGAVPGQESERRRPHEPEVGLEEMRREPVRDAAAAQIALVAVGERQQLHPVPHGKTHRRHRNLRAMLIDESRMGVRPIPFVELDRLIVNRSSLVAQRGNALE